MKKIFPLAIFGLSLLATSCSAIDPMREMADYEDYVVCSYDNVTQTAHATDYARYTIHGDMTSGLYRLVMANVPLYDGDIMRTDSLSNLLQFFETKVEGSDDTTTVRYTFFTKRPSTAQRGNLDLTDIRFSWLSSQAWVTATAVDGRYSLWSTPRSVRMYANQNDFAGPYGETSENSIAPRYDMTINTSASTVTVRATGVKYPVDVTDPNKTISISSLTWRDLPVRYTPTGFVASVREFAPEITGRIGQTDITPDDFVITNFDLTFNTDYGSTRRARFNLSQRSTGLTIVVSTYLDYHIASSNPT